MNSDDISINTTHFGKSTKTVQYAATISVCFAALSAGTVLAWSSPAISELGIPKSLNSTTEDDIMKNITRNGIRLTKKEEALLGSVLNLGALIYAIPTGYIADKWGRKMAIYLSAFSFLLGWFLIVIAKNVTTLLIARFFSGMGLGAICVVAPMYVGEIAENSLRATLSSYFQIFLSLGIFVTFVVGAITDYVTMSLILAIFPIILLITFPLMPESHVHLVKVRKINEAEKSLIRFRGNKRGYDINGEMEIIRQEVKKSSNNSGSITDIVSNKPNRNAMVAVLGMLIFQQMCGINAITFYTEQIFAEADAGVDPSLGAIIMGALQFVGGYLGMVLIEKAGRKFFLILSSIGMMLGLCVLSVFFHFQHLKYNVSSFEFIPVICAALFILSFTMAYGSIPYMMMHELLSPEIRAIGSGIAIVACWVTSFLITYAFPLALVSIGNYMTFYILTAVNALAIIFVIFFVPETRGRTLIEIQEVLANQ
ncbi:sugar transporter ERD6-like 7 [Harmonia axyridis]|uniref:sugar transporter ERD6-like 7 n=1 Tax=Harmonia axyridis TaxID=115357 RepID=UPI001E2778BF|nr:sugar transporter ERD6-like 7 [Harmonia axyridis]